MPPNIFHIDKVNKSNIKIDINLLRKQRDWFVKEEINIQAYLDRTSLISNPTGLLKQAVKATKEQSEIIQGTINLMDALLDLGEGYAA